MSARKFLVRIRSTPDEVESMEALELILAGASLEANLTVLFEGLAIDHLRAPWAPKWQQLTDFNLARLWVRCEHGESAVCDLPVRRVSSDELENLTVGWSRLDL